jgi:hypothetical protein
MQADVRIAVSASTRIGFAGPQVILNTMCEQDQERFDKECPPDFQSATYVAAYGQLDMVLENATPSSIAQVVGEVASLLITRGAAIVSPELSQDLAPTEVDMNAPFNYTRSRSIARPQVHCSFIPPSHSPPPSDSRYHQQHLSKLRGVVWRWESWS